MAFTNEQRLVFAARAANLKALRDLIEAGANPDGPVNDRGAPLFAALAAHHADIVRVLLENGASTSVVDRFGDGPLEYALYHQDDTCIFELLTYGATLGAHAKDTFKVLIEEAFIRRGSGR